MAKGTIVNEVGQSLFKRRVFVVFLMMLAFTASGKAQTGTGVLGGQVMDPSRAAVPGATIVLETSAHKLTGTSSPEGRYQFTGLAPGKYKLTVSAPGFTTFNRDSISISAGQSLRMDAILTVAMEQQSVEVTEQAAAVDTTPENNTNKIVVTGDSLKSLSDDPDELADDLQALAGLSVGPSTGQIYVDGFTGGQLPPKSSIQEIRVNQNPFSAEYAELGYGRIEIITKPGGDKWHGSLQVSGNEASFNSRNPFLDGPQPSYHTLSYDGTLGGSLGKKTSVFLDFFRRDTDGIAVIDTPGAPQFGIPAVNQAVSNPRARMSIDPQVEIQLTPNNRFKAAAEYWREDDSNNGLGQFSLPSLAYNTRNTEQTFWLKDTQTIGAKIVNVTRFKFERDKNHQLPASQSPTLNVEGYFNGGGNSQGTSLDTAHHYEFQNQTSISHGNHFFEFGGRVRDVRESNYSTSGFNGTFIFNSPADYQAGNPYQFTETALLAGGTPSTNVSLWDAALYAQDDWKLRPNLTISAGLRFETQTAIHDYADWAPRLGISWGIGRSKSSPKTVLRAGWGIFYDRFTEDLLLNAFRLNGRTEQSYVLYGSASNPLSFYPGLPSAKQLQNAQLSTPTSYRISPILHAPYSLDASVSLERQFGKGTSLSVNYVNSRGVHQFFTNNVNAPAPGTYDYLNPASSGVRPNGVNENVFEYDSEGVYRENQLEVHLNSRIGHKLNLFGYYGLRYASSDAVGPNSFPSNPYDIFQDYGRAPFDNRHSVFFGGNWSLPHSFQLSPFLHARSGRPYNITLSQDLNGSTVLNQRPAFASDLSNPANVVITPFGAFDTVPVAGEKLVPVDYLTAPGLFDFNLRVSKTFNFGRESSPPAGAGASGSHRPQHSMTGGHGGGPPSDNEERGRYHLTFSVVARNLFNRVNRGTPNGILNPPSVSPDDPNVTLPASASPLFGASNSLMNASSANRTIYLMGSFSF